MLKVPSRLFFISFMFPLQLYLSSCIVALSHTSLCEVHQDKGLRFLERLVFVHELGLMFAVIALSYTSIGRSQQNCDLRYLCSHFVSWRALYCRSP